MTEDQKSNDPGELPVAYVIPDDSSGWLLAERAAWHLLELQGEDVLIMDMRGLSDVCDFYVLATGTSQVHVKALTRHVQDHLLDIKEKSRGAEPGRAAFASRRSKSRTGLSASRSRARRRSRSARLATAS